ncbi:flagellar protein FlaG [Kurthia senegalensis]|uniref:flagellar protein FlaG n=1 Tax=Kurthia senegalensis TaxID=1033740 RepID=UPI000288FF5D|nr:flagellar protein FlaG [Kurthia senegalensis]
MDVLNLKLENISSNPIKNQKNMESVNHTNTVKQFSKSGIDISEMTDELGNPTEQAYQTAVNKMNEFMAHKQRNSKFVFHKDLERYYVEVVDAKSQEVIKEVPPKQLLDAYYEMQKLAGKIFDTQA